MMHSTYVHPTSQLFVVVSGTASAAGNLLCVFDATIEPAGGSYTGRRQ